MDLPDLCDRYFRLFESKNLPALENMLSPDVALKDWELSAQGIEQVIKATQSVMSAFDEIKIKTVRLHVADRTGVCEIELFLNGGSEPVPVVDIITFNSESLIETIRAYKG